MAKPYSEEDFYDGTMGLDYTPVAFDQGGAPIAPARGGSFDFSAYAPTQQASYDASLAEAAPEMVPQIGDQSISPRGVSSVYLGPGVAQGESAWDREQQLNQQDSNTLDLKARQFRGMQLYRQLRSGGASHEEAIMRAAPDLYANSASAFTKAVTPQDSLLSKVVPRYDEDGNLIANSIITGKHVSDIKVPNMDGKLNDTEKARLAFAKAEAAGGQSTLNQIARNPDSDLDKNTPARIADAQQRIARGRKIADEILSGNGGPVETVQQTVTDGPVTVTTKEQFDALPKGQTYIGKNGKTYRK